MNRLEKIFIIVIIVFFVVDVILTTKNNRLRKQQIELEKKESQQIQQIQNGIEQYNELLAQANRIQELHDEFIKKNNDEHATE